ncbi:hypothetical protein [Nonomuraea sp. SBT364]|uniref:hypothetical protein n=1 Tax=Nonomuraea sp. SBT364 TaxID=1580530 RepID=UPI000A820CF3|nr:hypothetical protein [Nonomuraea sp. SBT364]
MRARAWAVLAAALLVVQPATAHADARAAVKFYADSGDSCPHGVTEGVLDWVEGPVVKPVVRVDGSLSDSGPLSVCRADDMYSRASFTAYNGTGVVHSESVKADDQKIAFSFALADPAGVTAIDRVVVRVCRYSDTPIGISYCGPAATYKRP